MSLLIWTNQSSRLRDYFSKVWYWTFKSLYLVPENIMSNYYYGQSSSSTSNQSESDNSNVETKLVAVKAKSSSHPYFSKGSS